MYPQNKQLTFIAGGRNAAIPWDNFYPTIITSGNGPYLIDEKGTKYIDLWMGFGSQIFGHRDRAYTNFMASSIKDYCTCISSSTDLEHKLSQKIKKLFKQSCDTLRFAQTGLEATMYAVRLARAYTKRKRILVIRGGFHGANDVLIPSEHSYGIPQELTDLIDYVEFNDANALANKLISNAYASFILEPVQGNNTTILPEENYLKTVRNLCSETGTVLIFDEIMTGFRNNLGGAQADWEVYPDLTLLSKAIGGGLPISVILGKKEIMDEFYPTGKVFHAGTFYANPISLKSALYTLERLEKDNQIKQLEILTKAILDPVKEEVLKSKAPVSISQYGGMFSISFGSSCFKNDQEIKSKLNQTAFNHFKKKVCELGVLYPPMQTESAFISFAHQSIVNELSNILLQGVRAAQAFL